MPRGKRIFNHFFAGPLKYITGIFLFYLFFAWFVSDPARAGKVDRYILYYIDDIFHYCYVRLASVNPLAILNPYAKPVYTIVGLLFYKLLPVGTLSLRIMNSLLSAGVLFIQYKLMKRVGIEERYAVVSLFMTAAFPVYFLASISGLTEIMFTFLLIFAVYLLYLQRYCLSALCVSLLPLVRHEGVFYLAIWIYFFVVRKRWRNIILLFIPSAIWVLLNNHFFGRPVEYSLMHHVYLIAKRINMTPPPQTVSRFFNASSLLSIALQPLFIIAVFGWFIKLKDKRLAVVSVCWVSYISSLLIFTAILITAFNTTSRELRYIVPLVPFMSLYATYPIEKIVSMCRSDNRCRAVVYGIIFIFTFLQLPVNLHLLQHDTKVKEEALSPEKESEVLMASVWLNGYLAKNALNNIYMSGKFTTDRYIRRLWMYLDKNARFYPTINPFITEPKGEIKPLDIVNFDILRNADMKGVFVILNIFDNDQLGRQDGWTLIKSFPDIPLYFYLVGNGSKPDQWHVQ